MKKTSLILGILAVALFSCTKQETIAPEAEETRYTLRFADADQRILLPGESREFEIINTDEDGDPVNVDTDLAVTVYSPGNSTDLIAKFNDKWAASCTEAPASLYSIGSTTIKAGTNSAKVKIKVDLEKIRSSSYSRPFVLPLRIKTGNDAVKSHDLRYVVIPTYSKNSAGRTLVRYSTTSAYLEMYYTDQPNDKAMIYCPGGGYSELNDPRASDFQNEGIAVGVLWYTLPKGGLLGRYDITTQDAYESIDILRANADRWGGYTKVGTAGRSAGGHLAATTAQYCKDKVDFQVLLYAVINMDISKSHEGSVYQLLGDYKTDELVNMFTIYKHVSPDSPRAFLTWCRDDSTVPQEFNCAPMAEALMLAGVPVTTSIHNTGGHTTGPDFPGCLLQWLKTF